ncbi:type 4 pilus major pilin [Klebsiella sp. K4-172]|uniref:type 4 pilus major pilin n=1 Tax=Klebsiella sp. K4-172 TaxID=2920185 RepID=UPI0024DF0444|nr:type 4 pilus major pilin [Klebsiella sp. K4-172]MDK1895513.1 type IV pilin [Klebsiella sp. K4-172]
MKRTVLIKNIKSKKGFSLLELSWFLGFVVVFMIALFIIYPKVLTSQRSQAEINNIATIQTGVKALYTKTSSFTGLSDTVAVQKNIFPDNMLIGSGTAARPVNVFKGDVTLAVAATGPSKAPGSSFTITYFNVPAAECTKIITAVAGNFYEVGVGEEAANVKAAGDVLDEAKTAIQCAAGGNSNTIIFTSI